MVDNSSIEKLTEPLFPGKFIFAKWAQNGSKIGFFGFFDKFCHVSLFVKILPVSQIAVFLKL